MSTAFSIWSEQEQRAWQLPEKLTPVEWANRHRILDSMFSASPGRFKVDRTPYTVEPLNGFADPFTERQWMRIMVPRSSLPASSTMPTRGQLRPSAAICPASFCFSL